MPAAPRCPMCRAPHHLEGAKPGTALMCDSCQEVFEVGAAPAKGDPSADRPAAAAGKLRPAAKAGGYGTATGGGPTTVLSQDGSRLYYGSLPMSTADVKKNFDKMPAVVVAASRDIAFAGKAYYRATTGSKLGEFDFKTTAGDPQRDWRTTQAAITVSPDGLSVWVVDRDKNVARQFALEGEK